MSDARRWMLVTGASRGIGRACALQLARDGFGVVAHCRTDVSRLDPLLAEITAAGGAARALAFDVADRDACAQTLAGDIAVHGAYYGAVCNAGIARDGVFPGLDGDAWDAVLRTNLDAFYNVLHPLTMPMVRARRGGRIVVLSSTAGQIGNRGQVSYSASKAGLIGAAKALALELASRRITVNIVAPGFVDTDMLAGLPLAEALKQVPLGRAGQPEEVAAMVGYLCSDAAAYVTRQVLAINGGLC